MTYKPTYKQKQAGRQNSQKSPWRAHDPQVAAVAEANKQKREQATKTQSEVASASDATSSTEPKSGIRKRPFIPPSDDSLTDRALAVMAREPNPQPQEWFNDPSKLPKIPPPRLKRSDSPDST